MMNNMARITTTVTIGVQEDSIEDLSLHINKLIVSSLRHKSFVRVIDIKYHHSEAVGFTALIICSVLKK